MERELKNNRFSSVPILWPTFRAHLWFPLHAFQPPLLALAVVPLGLELWLVAGRQRVWGRHQWKGGVLVLFLVLVCMAGVGVDGHHLLEICSGHGRSCSLGRGLHRLVDGSVFWPWCGSRQRKRLVI